MQTIVIDKYWIIPAPDRRNGIAVRKRHMRIVGEGPRGEYWITSRVRQHEGKCFHTWRCYDKDEIPWPDEPEEVPTGELLPVRLGYPHRLFIEALEERGIVLDLANPFAFMDDETVPDEKVPVFGHRWD